MQCVKYNFYPITIKNQILLKGRIRKYKSLKEVYHCDFVSRDVNRPSTSLEDILGIYCVPTYIMLLKNITG